MDKSRWLFYSFFDSAAFNTVNFLFPETLSFYRSQFSFSLSGTLLSPKLYSLKIYVEALIPNVMDLAMGGD